MSFKHNIILQHLCKGKHKSNFFHWNNTQLPWCTSEPRALKSSLCSGTDAAVAYRTDRQMFKLTGCQFIGHHLVPHHGPSSVKVHNLGNPTQEKKNVCRSKKGSLCVVFDGPLQVTALPVEQAQLPHGVAVTSSEHQKAWQPQCW